MPNLEVCRPSNHRGIGLGLGTTSTYGIVADSTFRGAALAADAKSDLPFVVSCDGGA